MVTIPVDARLVTLEVEAFSESLREVRVGGVVQRRRERVRTVVRHPTTRTETTLRRSFEAVNRLWAPAAIDFSLRSVAPVCEIAPDGMAVLSRAGFHFLGSRYPGGPGSISLLLVGQLDGEALGGEAVEARRVCAVRDSAPDTVFAHEFGHLLNLGHAEPSVRFLMNPGLAMPEAELTAEEIGRAQASRLAQEAAAGPAH
jgi:hypothetical protein